MVFNAGGNQSDFTVTDNSTITQQITLTLNDGEKAALTPLKTAVEAKQPQGVLAAVQKLAVDNGALLLKVAEIVAKFV